ncbi:MAG: hypothetical protein JXR37_34425 [Kiritimatiellae bacterium]|nr:hypothetical protein [Kiritimatiellia bacterium]
MARMARQTRDLEERLVDFAAGIINTAEQLPRTRAGDQLASELVGAGTGCAILYGEAVGSGAEANFPGSLQTVIRQLSKARTLLRIVLRNSCRAIPVESVLGECHELLALVRGRMGKVDLDAERKELFDGARVRYRCGDGGAGDDIRLPVVPAESGTHCPGGVGRA